MLQNLSLTGQLVDVQRELSSFQPPSDLAQAEALKVVNAFTRSINILFGRVTELNKTAAVVTVTIADDNSITVKLGNLL